MPRPIPLLLVVLALSSAAFRSAAAAPHRAPTARLLSPPSSAHRFRSGHGDRGDDRLAAAGTAKPAGHLKPAAAGRIARAPRVPEIPPSSVGHPNAGRLEGGVRLDLTRKDLRVVPAYETDDVRWGLPALVGMIERAARGVAKRYPGAVLDVGDLSRKNGGEVHRHHSHESGRDADLGLYVVNDQGKQIHARTFIPFDARLVSPTVPGARFDLARNWLLVQLLLNDPRAHVSHIFIADPLRQALIAHAKRLGVSRALLVRAQLAMMQPTGAEPHDDHLHVRISCPRAMLGSCIEVARNAPSFRDRARIARVLRTPPPGARPRPPATQAAKHGGAPASSHNAPARVPAQPSRHPFAAQPARRPMNAAPEEHAAPVPPAAHGVAQDSMGTLDLGLFGTAPRAGDAETETDSDDTDAKGALDDSGAPKITD